jgi:hypothetical protein
VSPSTAPHTYAEWAPLLERFGAGDDSVLDDMRTGTIEWTSIVAERWTSRLSDALSARLKQISKQLQLALDRAAGDTFGISRAMLGARRALTPLHAVTSLPCLPENVRAHLTEELRRFVTETQTSLETGAKRIRHDGGHVLKALRDNPLTTPPPKPPDPRGDGPPEPSFRGRRVLL